MDTIEITIETGRTGIVTDITHQAASFVAGRSDGLLNVFVPHATAGVAILEVGAGSDDDLAGHLETLFPRSNHWRHRHGSPGHGADHVIPAFIAPSITVPVLAGKMALGVWQSIVVVDPNRDNPTRRVRFGFLSG